MQIHIFTDHNIQGDERLAEVCEQIVAETMAPIAKRLTRVEVHLKDERGPKGGEDIRATVEARPEGLRPYAAHADATDIPHAVKAAAKKLRQRLEAEFGKLAHH
ncbi:HPF/RaiA family ribosome-associated protein [Thalassobius vesicularis]|uniref:HPF/RaiA family ribosome-associated protein n=1 Tax=Thalassobius vesicularis TaxID=1294297 RepID=A0A4S3MB15_9RHOB|nr:HPF/RaiA family ribosome-associated protein [Thalassobius vesicularis]THD75767.1 HPF/RaiA family ribosome-associated protein [Thalassobius vesicularis]